ncbi:Adenosylcobinamide-phosphate synthase [Candidatus Syntrophocurvum alkaliphilum]|uniref:Cobalamin biosynthesis protein CobD n=1 Tax=Candidatus Syntrophocurvum alkaliphilum TaxID=2293317 RepID=A0A6I6DH20_9FIRM|nr:adenosylcobinamide-phosphate synthase CbiB [Candidatus Syntrophocurvum alkaliphilum]QGU00258.1 Adenosylcobinamide-phosphate synthase [Candidatus Syntrophocurvum alkaliphilum]
MMEIIIICAFILDFIIGDPRFIPHPVIYIGKIINKSEIFIRKVAKNTLALKVSGVLLTLVIVLGTYIFFASIIWLAFWIHNYLGIIISIFILAQALAVKSLYQHAINITKPLSKGNLPQAREALSMIVGRDTDNLDEKDITRATVESVSENTVDGITAPLFYAFLGGPPLAMAYKAINTLDSMIGYKNEKYLHLGWAAARLDDLANYIPARITAALYLLISPFTPGGWTGVWHTLSRDGQKHPSPNSGLSEAAVAGALNIKLGGNSCYNGLERSSPVIGNGNHILQVNHINQCLKIMLVISILMLTLGVLTTFFIHNLIGV